MPVEFEGGKRTEGYRFAPEDIIINAELNGRHDLPDIEWLIADIVKHGQHQPVIVRKDGDRAVLVAGFSRWRAIVEINRRKLLPVKLPIFATYKKVDEEDGFLLNISENRMRRPTTELDDAHNMQRLFNVYGNDEDEIAKIYFPLAETKREMDEARDYVRHCVSLISLAPEAKEAVTSGRVKPNAVKSIAKLASAQQKEVLANTEGKEEISRKDIAAVKPSKLVKARAAKSAPGSAELERRVWAVLEDVEGVLTPDNQNQYVDVDRVLLTNLCEYMKELRAAKRQTAA